MSNFTSSNTSAFFTPNSAATALPTPFNKGREFLPEISTEQVERIQKELHGMVGQRIVLMNDDIVQIRRAVNVLLEEPERVLFGAMSKSRVVAILSSDPEAGETCLPGLRQGGATHLAMNVPRVLQPALDVYQATRDPNELAYFLKVRGFKHPLSLLRTAVELGLRLVAVGDQTLEQPERKAASIESIAIDTSNILDLDRSSKVVLWAGSPYLKRSRQVKICNSSIDYLILNYNVFTVHSGNYLVDGGPLRKIVYDMTCRGVISTGKNRLIDNLATGIDGDVYGNWNAVCLQPKPAIDSSYFLTND